MIRYNINCTIHYHSKKYPRIYILKKSLPKVCNIVLPYMHTSMFYKLGKKKESWLSGYSNKIEIH